MRRRRCILPPLLLLRRFIGYTPTKVIKPGARYDLEEVLPLEFRYDPEAEVPILVKTASPFVDNHVSHLVHPGSSMLLYDDVSKYAINSVLKEILLHVKLRPEGSPIYFADFHDYKSILKTFEKLGSLFTYKLGTCCLKGHHGDLKVVRDTGVWKAIERETSKYYGYSGPWKFVKPTGYRMYCVSRIVFTYDALKICNHQLQVRYRTFARRESERLNISIEDADPLASAQKLKVAVEVERSAIGKGNLVFFMDEERAKDPVKVFAEMRKHINLDTGLAVASYAKHLLDEGDYLRCYSILQEPNTLVRSD